MKGIWLLVFVARVGFGDNTTTSTQLTNKTCTLTTPSSWNTSANLFPSPGYPYFFGTRSRAIPSAKEAVTWVAEGAGFDPLEGFSILTQLVGEMNSSQIVEAAGSLKGFNLRVFQDSAAEAGTHEALKAIKTWIQRRELKGEEAAGIIAALPETARHPDDEYTKAFFDLVTTPLVKSDPHLFQASVLAFSHLVGRMTAESALVDYPKPQEGCDDRTTPHVVWLATRLKEAVEARDGLNAQLFIRALGNVPHPFVLSVFKPYLDGEEEMSNFHRLLMVTSLDRLAEVHPRLAESVLFKIYQNKGEAVEVRAAAVGQLMKTDPQVEIMFRMAQNTNYEMNSQINAAVKSAIESAARLKSPCHRQLAEKAQAAANLLTPKQYGLQYSQNYFTSNTEDNLGYKLRLGTIQSPNSVVPSSVLYSLQTVEGGLQMKPTTLNAMMSSGDDLLELVSNQFEELIKEMYQGKGTSESGSGANATVAPAQWTGSRVASMLSVEADRARPVEANLMVGLWGRNRFFTLDNKTVNAIPQKVKEASSWLKTPESFNWTKAYNQYSIEIGFATEMGLPFRFALSKPALIRLVGEGSVRTRPDLTGGSQEQVHIPQAINASLRVAFKYSSKETSEIGFIAPFHHQKYLLGSDKNLHLYLPAGLQASLDLVNRVGSLQVEFLETNRSHKLVEYSSTVFTTKHDLLDLMPPFYGKNKKVIPSGPSIVKQFNTEKKKLSYAFDLKIENRRAFKLDELIPQFLSKSDRLHALLFMTKEKEAATNVNYTLWYNPERTTVNRTKISIAFDEGHNLKGNYEENDEKANSSRPLSDSLKRLYRYVHSASFGINDSYTQGIDASVEFSNDKMSEQYILTSAHSMSPLSTTSKLLVGVSKEVQNSKRLQKIRLVDLKLTNSMPRLPLMNYSQALETDSYSHSITDINFGNGPAATRIKIVGQLNKSEPSKLYLERSPLSKLCKRQMTEGNYITQACRNVTHRANFFDQYNFEIHTLKVPDHWKKIGNSIYSTLREMYYPHFYEEFSPSKRQAYSPFQKYKLNISLTPDSGNLNILLEGPQQSSRIENLSIDKWTRQVLSAHSDYSVVERLSNEVLLLQHYPTCSIDKTFATTFDNKTYPIDFGKCWHVVFQSLPKNGPKPKSEEDEFEPISVLIRDLDQGGREVAMYFGKEMLSLGPSVDFVVLNGEKYDVGTEVVSRLDNSKGNSFVEVHRLEEGPLHLRVPRLGLEMTFDGLRVKLQVSNFYRGEVRGLCGTFDGEETTDFTAPRNCILMDPFVFAGSYAITVGSCTGRARVMRHHSIISPCYKKAVILGDVVSESDTAGFKLKSNFTVKGASAALCTHYKIKVVERGSALCFSTRPQETCAGSCKATSKIEQTIDFHCVEDSLLARHWAKIVSKGASPDFTNKGINHKQPITLPQNCVPE